jgi:hypothetical protein
MRLQSFAAASSSIASFSWRRRVLVKCRYRLKPRDDFRDIRPLRQVEPQAPGADRLREEEDIGNARAIADGQGPLPAAGDHRLDSGHTLADPMTIPGGDGIGISLERGAKTQADAWRQQRMDLGSDRKRDRPRQRSIFRCIRQQWRFWLNLIEILDDRQRLGEENAAIRQ